MRTRRTLSVSASRFSVGLLVAGVLAVTALFAAGPASATNYSPQCPGDSGYLQTLLDTAPSGATITIYGTCYGNYTIDGSNTNNYGQLTLQGGSAGATLNGRGTGTTLTIENGALVTARNLTITNGYANDGGGLYVYGSGLTMTNVTVRGNRGYVGGGIFANLADLELTGVTVTRNTAAYQGGGIDLFAGQLEMTASTVSQNRTTEGASAPYGGGGLRLENANVLLTSSRITGNSSADYGGGIADYGGEFRGGASPFQPIALGAGLTLVNTSVDHNTAVDEGGGIYNTTEEYGNSPVTLQGATVFFNNALEGDGGGIANYGSCGFTASILATGSKFQGNQARNGDGGAVYNASGEICEANPGTALVTIAQSPTANGPNVVNSNQAMRGGGFANEQSDGVASLTLQPGATVRGNKASVTGGGVWNSCGSFSSLGQIFLNSPNNVVSGCF